MSSPTGSYPELGVFEPHAAAATSSARHAATNRTGRTMRVTMVTSLSGLCDAGGRCLTSADERRSAPCDRAFRRRLRRPPPAPPFVPPVQTARGSWRERTGENVLNFVRTADTYGEKTLATHETHPSTYAREQGDRDHHEQTVAVRQRDTEPPPPGQFATARHDARGASRRPRPARQLHEGPRRRPPQPLDTFSAGLGPHSEPSRPPRRLCTRKAAAGRSRT